MLLNNVDVNPHLQIIVTHLLAMGCLQGAPMGKSHRPLLTHPIWPQPAVTADTLTLPLQCAPLLKPTKGRKSLRGSSGVFCIFLRRDDFFHLCIFYPYQCIVFLVTWFYRAQQTLGTNGALFTETVAFAGSWLYLFSTELLWAFSRLFPSFLRSQGHLTWPWPVLSLASLCPLTHLGCLTGFLYPGHNAGRRSFSVFWIIFNFVDLKLCLGLCIRDPIRNWIFWLLMSKGPGGDRPQAILTILPYIFAPKSPTSPCWPLLPCLESITANFYWGLC